jgi:uncharacterized protein (DUF697 family)
MSTNDSSRIEQFKRKVRQNLTDIESRDDLSADDKASRIIHVFAATCAGVAVQPIPFGDVFVLTPIQAYMAERLAAIRGVPISKASAWDTVTDLAKVIGLGMIAQQVALGLYKVGLPFLAGFTTIPLVYGLTYAIGRVLDYLFQERAKGNKLSPEQIRAIWGQMRKEGKQRGQAYRREMNRQDRQESSP